MAFWGLIEDVHRVGVEVATQVVLQERVMGT